MTAQTTDAPPRPVDAIADAYVDECIERYPEVGTELGAEGCDDRWSDYSPAGVAAGVAHTRATVDRLAAAEPSDDRERIAQEAMLERLSLELELHEAHLVASRVSVIVGAVQAIRGVLDLMATDSTQAWENIARRLERVHGPLDGVRETLRSEAAQGHVSAIRQIEGTIEQIRQWTGEREVGDFFADLAGRAPEALAPRLEAAATHARRSFAGFADWLASDLAPAAPREDAVGRDRYQLESRSFLGAVVDLDEAYLWGFEELARIQSEQRAIARRLVGSDDIAEAYAALDADPSRQIREAEAFRDWMQELSDHAVAELAGKHFDIPDPIRRLECCIAPTHDGVMYYTGPTEDFSRPGRMWWSVPEELETFSTWKEITTVYHEGVPGHHLQISQNAYRSDLLNRWQRHLAFISGHGEGWALYAERLMEELGYLDEPGAKMGMLDAHAFRAVRVVIDIGMHLKLTIPQHNGWCFHPGATWTPELGYEFLRANTATDEASLRFELDRYLGWPGQAPSYKLGERIWLQARADAQARKGAAFDLRQFHTDALNLGSLGLDPLRAALARL